MKYKIINVGCHDETEGVFEFTNEQYEFLNDLFEELNKNSTCECMPTIHIEKMTEKEGGKK